MRERCPICHCVWQFIREYEGRELLGHFCELPNRYVCWDENEVYHLSNEEMYQNPPPRGDGE